MTDVTLPDGTTLRFPDGMSQPDMAAAIQKLTAGGGARQVGHTGGIGGAVTNGMLFGAGDEYLAGLSAVLGVQPDGGGGANWFDYAKPLGERYDTALGQIRADMGEYRDANPVKSGLATVAGGIAGAATIGRALGAAGVGLAPAATATGRGLQVMGGGAGAGAVEGFNSGEGGAGARLKSAAVGAGVGAIAAPLVGYGVAKLGAAAQNIGGKALAAVFRDRAAYDPAQGITPQGARLLESMGYDVPRLSADMQVALARGFEGKARGAINASDETVERMAVAGRFGVPLTRGQATGDVAQTAAEENFRAGTRGQGAYDVITGFDKMQGDAVTAAREGIGRQIGGPAADSIDAADAVIGGVRREAEAARLAGKQAYGVLDQSGAAIRGADAVTLGQSITRAVRGEGLRIDGGTPNAAAATKMLSTVFEDAGRGSVPFAKLEQTRQRLLQMDRASRSGANGADQVSMGHVVREFDDWLDRTMTNSLTQGSADTLASAKTARTLWAKYRQTFLGQEGADRFVRRIVEDDLTPDQVSNWLFGAASKIGGGETANIAKRFKAILGAGSPEFMAVKSAAWGRITKGGPGAVAGNIDSLLGERGRTLAAELYTPQELQTMREFKRMMEVLVPPKKSTNPSGTSYDVQRSVAQLVQAMGAFMGAGTGGVMGAAAGNQAVKTGGNFAASVAAKAAVAGIPVGSVSIPTAIGAGVGAGAAVQNDTFRR